MSRKDPKIEDWLQKVVSDFQNFSTEEKIFALDGIIDACEAAELKYLSDRLEIFLKRDFVRFLPTEICMQLLSWLDPATLGRCCLVSKTWNEAVTACHPAWIRACRGLGWKVDDSITSGSYWKKTYQRARKRLKQLKDGSAFEVSALIGHTGRVYSIRYDGRGLLASGSDDRSVRMWEVSTGECLRVVQTHTCADLAFDEYFVYTGSFDNTIACWDWSSGEMVRNYRGHTGAVFSVSYNEERDLLVSGSADKTVRLWQLSTGEQINMYHGHREWVTKVLLHRSKVDSLHHRPGDFVVLSMDKVEIRIWPISREVNCQSLCTLSAKDNMEAAGDGLRLLTNLANSHNEENHDNPPFLHPQLLFDGSRIMCSSERGILEWDFKDYTLTRILPHPNDPSLLLGVGNMMLLTADTRDNCLTIRLNSSTNENAEPLCQKSSPKSASLRRAALSPSPETVDYEVEQVVRPSTSQSMNDVCLKLPTFISGEEKNMGTRVTPTEEEGSSQQMVEDECVNDINYNSVKAKRRNVAPGTSETGAPKSDNPGCGGCLGRWGLPHCRWSKRGSNYICGNQSWLNGFSDVNHSGLVFAAALPDHSIYLIKWSEC